MFDEEGRIGLLGGTVQRIEGIPPLWVERDQEMDVAQSELIDGSICL